MIPDPQSLQDDRVPELYADGILDIGFGNGMVRVDLFSLSPVRKDENGQPLPALRQRVVMSLHGFLSSLAAMDGMRQRLEEAGVLVPNGGPAQGGGPFPRSPSAASSVAPAPAAPVMQSFASSVTPSAPAAAPSPPRSPNFG